MASDRVGEFKKIKRAISKLRREADRASGALDEVLKRLRDEHGCETLAAAEKLLEKHQRAERMAKKKFDAELRAFKAKWSEFLE